MRKLRRSGRRCAALGLLLCAAAESLPLAAEGVDPHSNSNFQQVAARHIDLKLKVDFERKRIEGVARFDLERIRPADVLILDTADMTIDSVSAGPTAEDQEEASYVFQPEEKTALLGTPLKIALKPGAKVVTVRYRTSPDAQALGWLDKEQTAGGTMPFFFTHACPNLTRSWIPIQDTPASRVTYHAEVRVPPGMLALMSAQNPREASADGRYSFDMPQPVPPYLIALAAGDIRFKPLGPRTGVYAEPPLLEKAAREFEDLPAMMAQSEELYGPYLWDRYDVLVMPNAFPAGGMENPRISFLSPAVVVGDKSAVSTLAHELAHSWSGNLVTNADWGDFWLNEGFTVYLERQIIEKVYGRDAAEMKAALGVEALKDAVVQAGKDVEITKLHVDLGGRNPRDNFTRVPYEKGYLFLRTLEEEIGKDEMNLFLKRYFSDHRFQSMTSGAFLAYLQENVFSSRPGLREKIRPEIWIDGAGLPPSFPKIESSLLGRVREAARDWSAGRAIDPRRWGWGVAEKSVFLSLLPMKISVDRLRELDSGFGFSKTNNVALLNLWVRRVIASSYADQDDLVEDFLRNRPMHSLTRATAYRELAESSPAGRARALRIYAEARKSYHPVTRAKCDAALGRR